MDAVLIPTPVFLHTEHFEAAVAAGKHICCEKPAAVDVAGVKRMLRAPEEAKPSRHAVFGFQKSYSPEYRATAKIVSAGQLAELLFMEAHFVRGMALKPVESRCPPQGREIRHWSVWRRTSGDFIVEQDCHSQDVLNWFAKNQPLRAIGSGGRIKRASGDSLDHVAVVYA